VDGDGVISMEDFRYMLDLHKLPTLSQFGKTPLHFHQPPITSLVGSSSAPPMTSSSSRDRGDVKERGNNGEVDR
jgi:hypothetical protein